MNNLNFNIINKISNLYNIDKLPKSMLFFGDNFNHCYKTLKNLSRWILCKNKTNICTCLSCRIFIENNHPDYKEINNTIKSNIDLDYIRNELNESNQSPVISKNKIFFLFLISDFNIYILNSILKILESPPENIVFILFSRENNLLPTITSRCCIFNMEKIENIKINKKLILDLYNIIYNNDIYFNKYDNINNNDILENILLIFSLALKFNKLRINYISRLKLMFKIKKKYIFRYIDYIILNRYLNKYQYKINTDVFLKEILLINYK